MSPTGLKVLPGGSGGVSLAPRTGRSFERGAPAVVAPPASIVLVGDHGGTRLALRRVLEGAGYHVHEASNGIEAWEAVLTRGPDLIVTDFMMPGMNGVELAEAVRASRRAHSIPILLVTAHVPALPNHSMPSLFKAVLRKPVERDHLLAAVTYLLEGP